MKHLKEYKIFERKNSRYYSYEINDILTELNDIGFFIDVKLISLNVINIVITKNQVSDPSGRKTFNYSEVNDVILRLLYFIEMFKNDLHIIESTARLMINTFRSSSFLPINLSNNELSNTDLPIERLHIQVYCSKA